MTYSISLTPAGKAIYDQRDINLERAVIFLVERVGVEQWSTRKKAIHDRLMGKLQAKTTPEEGISLRDRVDEFGWYLYLAEISISDPPAMQADSASRSNPYLSAFGRKLDSIRKIGNVDSLLNRLTRLVKDQDPDQALFELLVGAAYAEEGWSVEALSTSSIKSPDFQVTRGTRRFEVECKRFTRQSEYSKSERDHWLRLWRRTEQWLCDRRHALILTVTFHVELKTLQPDALLEFVKENIASLLESREVENPGVFTVSSERVNFERIHKELAESYLKIGCARERELVGGRHTRDGGFTTAIAGKIVTLGSPAVAGNQYWDEIEYAVGAYWSCDAQGSIDAKARGVMTRLSEATRQLTGHLPGIVHIGVECEEDSVELLRAEKVKEQLDRFHPQGQPLEWVFIHLFRGESLPAGHWAIDETVDYRGSGPEFFRPLRSGFLVLPHEALTRRGYHFDQPSTPTESPMVESGAGNFNSTVKKKL